ncbi:hypothetical protein [Rhodothermus bifroesti]|jgi:hypothetical protein|uniref:Uncharacterized protein n=1 Tax=Rhodothermus marinus TaxID=29549 RepID=A0A7V2B1C1_RHOMR|nr:hypothetical protein [Rhodothermus bifroesti]
MSILKLHSKILANYHDFVGSFIHIGDERVREFVRAMLEEKQRPWPEPLVQLSPAYRRDATVDELVNEGTSPPCSAGAMKSAMANIAPSV